MWLFDIGLHKISLGALILSLGLLVDDAIIAVEMMAIKLEQGFDRFRAASFAYTSTAFPMLTGTLVTVAGLPADRDGEERHRRVHALDLRGVGDRADRVVGRRGDRDSRTSATGCCPTSRSRGAPSLAARLWARLRGRPRAAAARGRARRPRRRLPTRRSTARFRALVDWCVGHRAVVIVATLAVFVGVARAVPLRAAAVLPGVVAPRAAGRPAPARGQLVRGDARRGEEARGDPRRASRASRATSPTSAAAARASTCRSTSSCSSRTSRSSC